MENLQNNNDLKSKMQNNAPVHPTINVPPPSGLTDRISNSSKKSNSKIGLIVSVVILLVVLGVGGWWYYAQGQVWFMLKQAKWDWGSSNLENYQQNTTMSLEVRNRNNGEQNAYAMLFGGDKFNIDIDTNQKNIGTNADSKINISANTSGFNLNLGLDAIKIDNKMYLKFDVKGVEDILNSLSGGMPGSADSLVNAFNETWFEMDTQDSYNIVLDKDTLAQVNVEFNNFLQELKDKKVFDFKDLKEDDRGYRKIQLNIKEDKIDDFVLSLADYSSKFYDLILEEGEFADMYKQSNEERIENFKKMKTEKPEDWEKVKKMFKSIDFAVFINPDTKNINGWELNLNNLEIDSGSVSTIFNGNLNYFIESIDYYEINKPDNVKNIESLGDIFTEATSMSNDSAMMIDGQENDGLGTYSIDDFPSKLEQDPDQDGLLSTAEEIFGTNSNNSDTDGDSYDDRTEINGCYNPNGEGRMTMDMYHDYCQRSYIPSINYGAVTEDMVNDLCTLWDDYVQQEIDIKAGDAEATIWWDLPQEEVLGRCQSFDEKYSLNEEDQFFTTCQGSLIIANLFCNVPLPI